MAKITKHSDIVGDLTPSIKQLEAMLTLTKQIAETFKSILSATGGKDLKIASYKDIKETTQAIQDNKKAAEGLQVAEKEQIRIQIELEKLQQQKLRTQKMIEGGTKKEVDEYGKLSKAYNEASRNAQNLAVKYGINSAQAQKASKVAKEMGDRLKEVDATVGKSQRNVGNYTESINKATLNLGEMKRELMMLRNMSFVGKSEDEVKKLKLRIGELMDKMKDMKAEMQVLGTEKAAVLVGGLKFIAAGVEGVVGSLSVLGVESETIRNLEKKMTSLIAVTHALAEIEDTISSGKLRAIGIRIKLMVLETKETIQKWASVVATNAQARAETAKNIALGKGNIIVRTAAAVQWLWNAALAANPVVWVAAGVISLVAAIGGLVWWLGKSTDNTEKYNKQLEKQKKALEELKFANEEYIKALERGNATETMILKNKIKFQNEYLRNLERQIKSQIALRNAESRTSGGFWATIFNNPAFLKSNEKWIEQNEKLNELFKEFRVELSTRKDLQSDLIEKEKDLRAEIDKTLATSREREIIETKDKYEKLLIGAKEYSYKYKKLVAQMNSDIDAINRKYAKMRIDAEFEERNKNLELINNIAQKEIDAENLRFEKEKSDAEFHNKERGAIKISIQKIEERHNAKINEIHAKNQKTILDLYKDAEQLELDALKEKYDKLIEVATTEDLELNKILEKYYTDRNAIINKYKLEDLKKEWEYNNKVTEIQQKIAQERIDDIKGNSEAELKLKKELIDELYGDKLTKAYKDYQNKLTEIELSEIKDKENAVKIAMLEYNEQKRELLRQQGLTDAEINKLIKDAEIKAEHERYKEALELADTFFTEMNAKKQRQLDREIDQAKRHQDTLRQLAAKGIEDAKDNLAYEEKEIAKKELAKDKLMQKQKQQELMFTALKTMNANLEAGQKPLEALGNTMSSTAVLMAFVRSLPAFHEGSEKIEDDIDPFMKGRDGHLVRVEGDEAILTGELNKKKLSAGMNNFEMVNRALLHKGIERNKWDSNEMVLRKLEAVEKAIIDKPSYLGRDFDKTAGAVVEIIEYKNMIEKNHYKLKKL